MSLVSIPREALAELLRAAGSRLTPEEYLAALPITESGLDLFRKYPSRAVAAAFSKYFLLVAAIISVGLIATPGGFGFESILVSVILVALTYFEYGVHSGFRNHKPEAPMLGFRNQSTFAIFIVVYCIYHAFVPTPLPPGMREMTEPDFSQILPMIMMVTYLIIGAVGGISQFCLALYYRSARMAAGKA